MDSSHTEKLIASKIANAHQMSGALSLNNLDLTTVPPAVYALTDLSKLSLARNNIVEIKDDLEFWVLRALDLSHNKLRRIPTTIKHLVELRSLDASHNEITEMPIDTGLLEELKILELNNNHLESLPDSIFKLRNLATLALANNRLSVLPKAACALPSLKNIDLSSNPMTSLPSDIGLLDTLVELKCANCKLTSIPDETGDITSLIDLRLSRNRLSDLPVGLKRLSSSLKYLDISNNSFNGLPPVLFTLKNLETLNISGNRVVSISGDVKNMINLVRIEASGCALKEIPPEIEYLEALSYLDLANNDLGTLPGEVALCDGLKTLVLDGNPLRALRRDIVARGIKAIKDYLRTRIPEEKLKKGKQDTIEVTKAIAEGRTSGSLDMSRREMVEMDDGIIDSFGRQFLVSLDLSHNKIRDFGISLNGLRALQHLDVSFNGLEQLPDLSESPLKSMNVCANRLKSVPQPLFNCSTLEKLNIMNNPDISLPNTCNLPKLIELHLAYMRLAEFPIFLVKGSCPSLRILNLSNNSIRTLPSEIYTCLPELEDFDISNNDISIVTPEVCLINGLSRLELAGNPLRQPRIAILSKGTKGVLEYLKTRLPV